MHADFSVELGRDDPALELPWRSDDPQVRYYDLKNHPESVIQIPEATAHPLLRAFLIRMNAAGSPLATAKCDAWHTTEVTPEEEIFGDRKFVSYVDLVFEDETARESLAKHETFAKELCRLLARSPEIVASVEVVIRRCYYHQTGGEEAKGVEDGGRRGTTDGGDREELEHSQGRVITEEPLQAGPRQVTRLKDTVLGKPQEKAEFGKETVGEIKETVGEEAERREAAEASDRLRGEAERRQQAGGEMVEGGEEKRGVKGSGVGDPEELARTDSHEEHANDDRSPGVPDTAASGFCLTVYVSGFGCDEYEPERRWEIALALLQNAVVQLVQNCE